MLSFFCIRDLCYAYCRNKYNSNLLIKAIEKGTQLQIGISNDRIFPRPEIVNCLKEIFQPDEYHSYYHIVYGETGTEKTTLARIALREVGGTIYVDIPPDVEDFGEEFGNAFNFAEEQISFTKQLI